MPQRVLCYVSRQLSLNVDLSTSGEKIVPEKVYNNLKYSFRRVDDTCFLSDMNVGLTGALRKYYPVDYYELKIGTVDCSGKNISQNNEYFLVKWSYCDTCLLENSCDLYTLYLKVLLFLDNSINFECSNKKCIKKSQLCDGSDDCGNRQDEKNCKASDFGYSLKLAGSTNKNEGRVEVTG